MYTNKRKKILSFSILLHIMVIHQNVKSVQRVPFLAESDVSWYPAESADETKLPAKWPRKRERPSGREERWEKNPWRTAPLFRFSPALPSFTPSSFSTRNLLQAFSDELTSWDLVPSRKSPPLRGTAMEKNTN